MASHRPLAALPSPAWLRTDFAPDAAAPLVAQPYFCEENAIRQALALADLGAPEPGAPEPMVVFILNRAGTVLFFNQRAVAPRAPLVWDYHVVVQAAGRVLDADCRAGVDLRLSRWLAASFPYLDDPDPALDALRPAFRPVTVSTLLGKFSSDRRHMRDDSGHWLQPPPPWPAPSPTPEGAAHTLPRFLAPDDPWAGPLCSARQLLNLPAADFERCNGPR